MGLFDFLKKKPEPQQQEEIQALEQGLEKTSTGLFSKIGRAVVGKSKVDEEVLIEEKEEAVEIKSIVRDERTHKIIGSILLFISFFLFVAFVPLFQIEHEISSANFQGKRTLLIGLSFLSFLKRRSESSSDLGKLPTCVVLILVI